MKKKNKKNDARPGFEPGSPRSEVDRSNHYSTAGSLQTESIFKDLSQIQKCMLHN